MKTARNRTATRPAHSGGMFQRVADQALLDSPAGRATLGRIDGATCRFFAGDRDRHVRQVTLVCLRAKAGR